MALPVVGHSDNIVTKLVERCRLKVSPLLKNSIKGSKMVVLFMSVKEF